MIPHWPSKTACVGTYRHATITPCLVHVTYCTLTKVTQLLGKRTAFEYGPLYSFAKGLN